MARSNERTECRHRLSPRGKGRGDAETSAVWLSGILVRYADGHRPNALCRVRMIERNGETVTNLSLYFTPQGSNAPSKRDTTVSREKAVQKAPVGALAPWQTHRAIQLLSATYAGCSVETLANACGLSSSHFAHAFKASTGVPPHRWLLLHRVQCARELIESTTGGLAGIALNCGFSDQSHLTRAFHSVTGSSPAAWRRERRLGVTAAELELSGEAFEVGAT